MAGMEEDPREQGTESARRRCGGTTIGMLDEVATATREHKKRQPIRSATTPGAAEGWIDKGDTAKEPSSAEKSHESKSEEKLELQFF